MSRIKSLDYQYRFLEVGLSVNGFEFYLEFCIPVNLCMRRFNSTSRCYDKISVEDWLCTDFPVILGRKLSALNSSCRIEVSSIKTILPSQRALAPVVRADSLPWSWCDPFVYLIASYFINNYRYEK